MKNILFFALWSVIASVKLQAMLHQLPSTDEDMVKLAENYPAVGRITREVVEENKELQKGEYSCGTGTLIEVPKRPDLAGRIVLTAEHCFTDWEKNPTDIMTFSVFPKEDNIKSNQRIRKEITRKIVKFIKASNVQIDQHILSWKKSCVTLMSLLLF